MANKLKRDRPTILTDYETIYCAGCGHGTVERIIAESLESLNVEKAIGVSSIGCSVVSYFSYAADFLGAPHGRAPAAMTGIKMTNPEVVVFGVQGDGDAISIGLAETLYAANRGIGMTVIVYNNAVYGMTGGQCSPTTPLGAETTTTPGGRDPLQTGTPIRLVELLNQFEAPMFLARTAVTDPRHIRETARAVRRAFEIQIDYGGYGLVEILGPCSVSWHMTASQARRYVNEELVKEFPLGTVRDLPAEVPDTKPRHLPPLEWPEQKEILRRLDLSQVAQFGKRIDPDAHCELIFAGSGGQGIQKLGSIVAEAAVISGYADVVSISSYGPEARGGKTNNRVVMTGQNRSVKARLFEEADIAVIMNTPSMEAFGPKVRGGGLLLYDSSMVAESRVGDGVSSLGVPATSSVVAELKTARFANSVMLGAFLAATNFDLLTRDAAVDAVRRVFGEKSAANETAVDIGIKLVQETEAPVRPHPSLNTPPQ